MAGKRILVIPDLHGKAIWKKSDFSKYDKIIFLGDYCDSFSISDVDILKNLEDIIETKKRLPDKIILLLGNHCLPYLYFPGNQHTCSGFRKKDAPILHRVYKENYDLFQVSFEYKKHLFSHAGITSSWYNGHKQLIERFSTQYTESLSDILCSMHKKGDFITRAILHNPGRFRGGFGCGGITWADKDEFINDDGTLNLVKGYHQIVGHTRVSGIERYGNENESVTFCDILDTKTEFHEVLIV